LKPAIGLIALVVVALVAGYALGSNDANVPQRAASNASVTSQQSRAQPPATTSGMDEAAFWQLISSTREAADHDTGRQSELLEERLSQLPAQQIVDYQRIRHGLDEGAYTWDLWGAAYVIEDGCSDDCFRDFRAYLISLGRGPYEAAMRDPDSLAPVVQDAEEGDWENADNVAPDAYESVAGEDIPADDSDLSGDPRGEPWDDEAQETLVQRYPRLAARFR
jgi:Protein of unknown function (DUF4240)